MSSLQNKIWHCLKVKIKIWGAWVSIKRHRFITSIYGLNFKVKIVDTDDLHRFANLKSNIHSAGKIYVTTRMPFGVMQTLFSLYCFVEENLPALTFIICYTQNLRHSVVFRAIPLSSSHETLLFSKIVSQLYSTIPLVVLFVRL